MVKICFLFHCASLYYIKMVITNNHLIVATRIYNKNKLEIGPGRLLFFALPFSLNVTEGEEFAYLVIGKNLLQKSFLLP